MVHIARVGNASQQDKGTPHRGRPHFLPSSTSYTLVDNANILVYVLVCHSEYKSSSQFFSMHINVEFTNTVTL